MLSSLTIGISKIIFFFFCHMHNIYNILLKLQMKIYIRIRRVVTLKFRKRALIRKNYIHNEIKKHDGEKNNQI